MGKIINYKYFDNNGDFVAWQNVNQNCHVMSVTPLGTYSVMMPQLTKKVRSVK